jgi:hypothetical protein
MQATEVLQKLKQLNLPCLQTRDVAALLNVNIAGASKMLKRLAEHHLIYAVSLARTRKFMTPAGEFSIHHLDAKFFFGFELLPGTLIKMATPEKALIDIFYFSPAKTQLFKSLPEIELPKKFNTKTAQALISHIPSARRRSIVTTRLTALLQNSHS